MSSDLDNDETRHPCRICGAVVITRFGQTMDDYLTYHVHQEDEDQETREPR